MMESNKKLGPFLTNDFGDRYLYEVNRSAFNKAGSDALFRQMFGEGLFQEDTLNIVIGADSGLLPNFVAKRGVPDGSRFLFVELPEVIDRLGQSAFLGLNSQGIELCTYDDWKGAAERLDLADYLYINKVSLHQSVAAVDANLHSYRELYWTVSEELTRLTFDFQASLGIQGFLVRQLENLAENRHPSLCLQNAFKGKTAVLLGGGPSLDEIIPWLKSNRDRVVILAVSRICRRLLECGVTPHIVFSVDPNPISFDISKELFHYWRNTLFVHAYHVSPPLLAQWRGNSVYSGPRFPWKTDLNVETLPSAGPTVTNMALASAVAMGFSRVLLAGVDLCHSKEGFTHAQGSNEYDIGPQLGKMGIQVETYGGWMAETSPDYACAMGVIDSQAKQAKERGCKVINTALGAAKTPNIRYAHPDEMLIGPLQEPPEATIARALPRNSREERIIHYRNMLDELMRAAGLLKKIRRLVKAALKCTDNLPGHSRRKADLGPYRRMNKIEKTLNRQYKDFVPLVKQFSIRNFLRVIRPGEGNVYIRETDRNGRLRIYYGAYVDSAKRLISLLENAEQRIRARLEEEEDRPDMDILIKQWKADHQPGRYLIWKDRNPGAKGRANISYKSLFQRLEDQFESMMKETETGHMRHTRAAINLSGTRSKAFTLFQKEDTVGLERLAAGLASNSDPKAKHLLCISQGYLEELHGNRENAMEKYQSLISENTDEPILEDALRRIAFICIDKRDMRNTVAALQCLAQLSPAYAPQYADALTLIGDGNAATDVYTGYLQRVPDDLGTMMKLGTLYRDLHADEAARMAFQYVLERDPANTAAKAMLEKQSYESGVRSQKSRVVRQESGVTPQ